MIKGGLDSTVPTSKADVFKFFISPRGDGFDGIVLTEGVGGIDNGDKRTAGGCDVSISATFPENASIRATGAGALAEDVGSVFFGKGLIKAAPVRT